MPASPVPRRSAIVGLAALLGVVAGCSGAPAPVVRGAAPGPVSAGGRGIAWVTPSRLVPELVGDQGVVERDGGERRILAGRMRVVARADGGVERADEVFPVGAVQSVTLPPRLGGGYLFRSSSGTTQLWRASTWLGKLTPLAEIAAVSNEIVPGFDRLYVKLANQARVLALDPETGKPLPVAHLPPAAAYGPMAFIDGWRAVVVADLAGPLVTFDAGASWRTLPVPGRVGMIAAEDDAAVLFVDDAAYSVDARGNVARRVAPPTDDAEEAAPRASGPLGKQPLRQAVATGFPDGPSSAVVAAKGALVRVSLPDGAVLDLADHAFPDEPSSCQAVRFGAPRSGDEVPYGFVCGERDGPTSVHAFVPPLGVRPVLSFPEPRFVAASGNGRLVVRGPCAGPTPAESGSRSYCIVAPDGATREFRVKGELGAERVVALRDGRIAVLVPPRLGAAGQVTLVEGSALRPVALRLPREPELLADVLAKGIWLEGVEEREPNVLSAWVEGGGPVVGVRVKLADGVVEAGPLRTELPSALLAGRFGLVFDDDRAEETTDGGFTWTDVELVDPIGTPPDATMRTCGPVGCVLPGFVRVGWGATRSPDDLGVPEAPPPFGITTRTSGSVGLACEAVGRAALRPKAPSALPAPSGPVGAGPRASGSRPPLGRPVPPPPRVGVEPFRGVPAPAVDASEIALDAGSPSYDPVAVRVYAWGKKGADWSRTGSLLVRFDDRFDAAGGVRSSAASRSPWADENAASEALGRTGPGAQWRAVLDSAGRGALVSGCRAGACDLWAVAEGETVLPLRDATLRGTWLRPLDGAAVRLGETWYFLAQTGSPDAVQLYRADLGAVRLLATFPRPSTSRFGSALEAPRLVRRAQGGGLGILVTGVGDPGARTGGWVVYRIDPESGAIGEPVLLAPGGRKDLAGVGACEPHADGWLVDARDVDAPVYVRGAGKGTPSGLVLDGFEFRLRLDPGSACIDAVAANADGDPGAMKGLPAGSGPTLPLALTEKISGRRSALRCTRIR